MNKIYLIEEIWVDSMENESARAVGYSPIGFLENEDDVVEFCCKGRDFTNKDCWAIGIIEKSMPQYVFRPIENLKS